MSTPTDYYVDPVSGQDDVTEANGGINNPWKTLRYAIEEGIDGDPTGLPFPIGHDTTNGVQFNIKAGGSTNGSETESIDIKGKYGSVDEFGMPDEGAQAANISADAPLIFRGYQTAKGDWYPGKAGDEPTLYGYRVVSGFGTSYFAIFKDVSISSSGKESNHLIFSDLVFKVGSASTVQHVCAKSANTFLNCKFQGGVHEGGCVDLTDDNTFINCHFSDMGDNGSGSGASSRVALNHAGSGLTLINCVFDFLANAVPYACLKIAGTGANHLIGNVFMCGNDTRIMNWGGTPSGLDSGLLVLINNTFYSEMTGGHARENAFVGNNSARRIVAIDNLLEGWNNAMPYKSALNILATGGNSAYNNTADFPTAPDVWFEFAGGNFSATDANSNKNLVQSPFLDAANKKMSCRPARVSGGDEAVVGQSLSLYEGASTIIKRGDRGAVPRGPLTPPIDGGIIG